MDTPGFGTQGCLAKCHPGSHAGGGGDNVWLESGKADIWHMKAARALPAGSIAQSGTVVVDEASHQLTSGTVTFHGWADDKWIGQWSAKNAPDGGSYDDAGKSAYSHNRTEDESGPLYMEAEPADFVDAMTLFQSEIDAGEAVEVATADVDAIWAKYAALRAVVSESILGPPQGSRADVEQVSSWNDSTWTMEFRRALDTGHPDDDVIFGDLGQTYDFGVAWMDNIDGARHDPSSVIGLRFTAPPTALPTSGGALARYEAVSVGAMVVGALCLATGVIGLSVSRRRAGSAL
jgi:hypothetical protein